MGDLIRFPHERHFDNVQSVRVDFCEATGSVVIDIRAFGAFSPHLLDEEAIIVIVNNQTDLVCGTMTLVDSGESPGTHYRFRFIPDNAAGRVRPEFYGLCRFSNVKWVEVRQKGQAPFRTFANRFFRRKIS